MRTHLVLISPTLGLQLSYGLREAAGVLSPAATRFAGAALQRYSRGPRAPHQGLTDLLQPCVAGSSDPLRTPRNRVAIRFACHASFRRDALQGRSPVQPGALQGRSPALGASC